MMEDANTAGRLVVTVSHEEEIEASHADLFVTVRGTSLFTGKAALTKAREVAALVGDLKTQNVSEADIRLQGVQADVTSGLLGKTSSATYSLKIRVQHLDSLADVLGAITSQKNTALRHIAWVYGDGEAQRLVGLDACLAKASARAERIARGLGVRLTGVARCTENFLDPESGQREGNLYASSPKAMALRSRESFTINSEEIGLDVSHAKRITVVVETEYFVSGFAAGTEVPPAQA